MSGAKDQLQYSLRMDRALADEVKTICALLKLPKSKFILDAIRAYVARERPKVQRSLTESLRVLQGYAKRDPEFKDAIKSIADAETSRDVEPEEGKYFDVRERQKSQSVGAKSLEEFLENA